ncbi:hypothetical protein [Geoalkalibacter sp.]|uniref:hypothetical protein n=1 Tax=Geoalkalibacter sp. TaxID=3041440 RepID=UPI00272ECB47|nr:hypothetical protein [Geoalkalibacter sp.]
MDLQTVNFIGVALLALIVGLTLIVVHLSQTKLRRELAQLREELALWQKVALRGATPIAEDGAGAVEPPGTQALGTVVEAPPCDEGMLRERLRQAGTLGGGSAPERYRQAATLADKGLAGEDIAEVLQVSPDEARQLVRLAEVGRRKN